MQKAVVLAVSLSFLVTGCAESYQQPIAQSMSMTEIQGQCFANFKVFLKQVECIDNIVKANSNLAPNSYAQEYYAYMQSLVTKVKSGKLSGDDARVKLTNKLNEVRALQNNEIAAQEQLDLQRAANNAEVLRQYQANQQRIREKYPAYVPIPSTPVVANPVPQYQPPAVEAYQPPIPTVTECRRVGNQVFCTSQQSKY